jgi:pimeloyl-ACP methyl ester carboxylesterase
MRNWRAKRNALLCAVIVEIGVLGDDKAVFPKYRRLTLRGAIAGTGRATLCVSPSQRTRMQGLPLINADIVPPHPFLLGMEYRAVAELVTFVMWRPLLALLPRGDRHAVLIVPGFVQDQTAIAPLRHALGRLGYDAWTWDQGTNLGFSRAALESLRAQANNLARTTNKRVSIIGWSLGGIFARELAFEIPDQLRLVITLGSPFGRNPHASNMRWLYDIVTKSRIDEIDDEMVMRIRQPLPVPSTAIYSRTDGIVAWETCIEEALCETNENIEVLGSHSGLGFNVQVLWVIANRLAQPSDGWRRMSL